MPALLICALEPFSGKTSIAVGLAQRWHQAGRKVTLLRLAGDNGADPDAELFASLPFNSYRHGQPLELAAAVEVAKAADLSLVEAGAGDPRPLRPALAARAVIAAPVQQLPGEQLPALYRDLGKDFGGLIATFVPRRRLDSLRQWLQATSLPALALLPEDRTLAALTLEDAAMALEAQTIFADGHRHDILDPIHISPISADPGQGYFARLNPKAVILRSDKPDLQLAALNAGASCLVMTSAKTGSSLGGGLPLLPYVLQRAEEEQIPLLLTNLDTVAAVQRLEDLYGRTRFRGEGKVERLGQLLAEGLDLEALDRALTT